MIMIERSLFLAGQVQTIRRALCLGLCLLVLAPLALAQSLTDLKGRQFEVDTPVASVSIDDGRFLTALALLSPDPGKLLAAWPKDIHRIGEVFYQQLLAASSSLAEVPKVASSAGRFNLEALLAANPGAAVVSLGRGPSATQVRVIESVGIPVVYIDFFQHPLENQAPSLRLLGQLVGREKQAEAYIAFRQQHLQAIADKVATLAENDRPGVLLEAHAGISNDCCYSPGRGNMGEYIRFVGGHNIGADVLAATSGKLSLEYVIAQNPDVYIATGGPALRDSNGLVLGPGVSPKVAKTSLARVASRPGIAQLAAVKQGRTYGISHLLLNSPLDIVAIEWLAKWIHPELFADLDPAATLAEINQRFLAVPYGGTNWVSLKTPRNISRHSVTSTKENTL